MRISSSVPKPPREIMMVFPVVEGWALVAALREYADKHPDAHNASNWSLWATELDKELRR